MARHDRGQAHTLESVVGAILLVTSLVFALQVTAVTPLSASTSSQHIENQHQATGEGVLATAHADGALKPAVLYWDLSNEKFHDADAGTFYTNNPPTNRFGAILERSLGGRGIAYNVFINFQNPDGNIDTQRMVYQGQPSDNAISARRTLTLYDDDQVFVPDSDSATFRAKHCDMTDPNCAELGGTGDFYAPDIETGGAPDDAIYNIVEVEVVVWRQ